ncbi:MAG: isoleucine--tRNA ligase, partial [Candidatus Izemoplasmataceae bacterium]
LPGKKEDSVYLENMPSFDYPSNEKLVKKYDHFMQLRDHVLKALEEARNEKIIGKSLQAHVVLYPNESLKDFLNSFDGLNKLFIVSKVTIKEGQGNYKFNDLSIDILEASGDTCAHCWHVTETDEFELCERCRNVLSS